MKFLHLFFAALCGGALLGGCKGKDGEPGPAGASLSGNIVGFVTPRDEFGRIQAKSGVTVTLENTSPAQTATTDANGRFELTNVPSGTYNIAYTKAGLGTVKTLGYPHAGGTQPAFLYNKEMIGISATTVSGISVGPIQTPSSGYSDYHREIDCTLSNPSPLATSQSYMLRAAVFVGNSPSVTAQTGEYIAEVNSYNGQPSQYGAYMTRSELNQRGFATGTTAYAIFYGRPYEYGEDSYPDFQTGRRIYTILNPTPSQVVSFIVP